MKHSQQRSGVLVGQPGELRAKIQITRKATGKVEEFEIVSAVSPDDDSLVNDAINGAPMMRIDHVGNA